MEPVLKAYIKEAIEVEKAGLEVDYKKTSEFVIPEEFQNRLVESPALKKAFDALTPGRQRGYILYFSGAKQSKTRTSRIEKCMPQILEGKGLVRLRQCNSTQLLFGLSSFLYLFFRDIGCIQAYSSPSL